MPGGVAVADVGTGDGKLASWLAGRGQRVVATDDKPGPVAEARRLLEPLGLRPRLGDGLGPLAPGEVEFAVIAGMGGREIARILDASPEVVAGLRGLVLQPVQHVEELLAWLAARGFTLLTRRDVQQGRHRYAALLVVPPYSTAL